MENFSNHKSDIMFTSRCPQIREAQWVCQKVRAIPHISNTRIDAVFHSMCEKHTDVFDKVMSGMNFEPKTEIESKIQKIFLWNKTLVSRMCKNRGEWNVGIRNDYRCINNILCLLKHEKMGNCGEDAYLAAAILRMNRKKYAYTASLKVGSNYVDHRICLFNKDGSQFDGKITKKTIIVDPWLGFADFASNMATMYKNLCSKIFPEIGDCPYGKIDYYDVQNIRLSADEVTLLIIKHPELITNKTKLRVMN